MSKSVGEEQMDATNIRAIEGLQCAADDTVLHQMYGEALALVRQIAAETALMVAEIEAEHAYDSV